VDANQPARQQVLVQASDGTAERLAAFVNRSDNQRHFVDMSHQHYLPATVSLQHRRSGAGIVMVYRITEGLNALTPDVNCGIFSTARAMHGRQ
jgi:hypothetical protein